MATTYYSTLATAMGLTTSMGGPAEWQLPGVINTPVRCYIDWYTSVGEVSGSIIHFFTDGLNQVLPTGANILKMEFYASASTGALTISVGDMSSATRYVSASATLATLNTVLTVSGVISYTPTATAVATYAPYIIGSVTANAATTGPGTVSTSPTTGPGITSNGDNQIILTTGGASLVAGTIICGVLYFTFTN